LKQAHGAGINTGPVLHSRQVPDDVSIPLPCDLPPLTDALAQSARETILGQLRADPRRWLSEYATRFGNLLNADDAATLFDVYNEDRARFRVAVHPAATWIRDELFRQILSNSTASGDKTVVFTSGSNAAGKSTALRFTNAANGALAVFDSTLSNLNHARTLVGQVLAASKLITLLHVDRPLDDAFQGMLERGRREGRLVTINQLIHSHSGAAETVRTLWSEFRQDSRFAFRFIANSSVGVREGSIELARPRDYTRIREQLNELLSVEYRSARIDRAAFDRIRG
jgi:hypothetical protein